MNTDLGPIDQRLREAAKPHPSEQEMLLERIDDALARLEDGRFGYCESCGGEISLTRLVNDPAARQCSKCDPD